MQESTRKVQKSVPRAVFSRMQLTLHATRRTPHVAASCSVHAMPARSVKTQWLRPSIVVKGLNTTAIHPTFRTSSLVPSRFSYRSIANPGIFGVAVANEPFACVAWTSSVCAGPVLILRKQFADRLPGP